MSPAPTRSLFDEDAIRVLEGAESLEDAAHPFLGAICFALGWRFAALWTVDPDGLRCIDVWHRQDEQLAAFAQATRQKRFMPGEGLVGHALAQGPVWIRDVNLAGDVAFVRSPSAAAVGLHGAFALPVLVRGQAVGVLEFYSASPEERDDDLLEMLSVSCARIGRFIESETNRRRLSFQTALLEAQGEAGLDGIWAFSDEPRILWWNRRFIQLWDLDASVMEGGDPKVVLKAAAEKTRDPTSFLEISEPLVDDMRGARRDDIELLDGRVLDRWTSRLTTASGIEGGRVVYYRDVTEQRRAEDQLRRDERWANFVARVGTALSESLEYSRSIERLSELVIPELGDWCAIHIVEPGGSIRLEALAHVEPEHLPAVRRLQEGAEPQPDADIGVMRAIRTGRPELYPEVGIELLEATAQERSHLAQLRDLHMTSAMIVPLVCRSRVLGAITFAVAGSGRVYDRSDLARAEDVATRAAINLDNARLYQEHERVSQTLQRSLLPPRLPEITGVELAARYHPAGQGTEIGGDFFDVFPVGPKVWGMVIGDVSGKGVEAAAVTAVARHTVRTAALTTRQPSRVLSLLNSALLEETAPDSFCTAAFGFIEVRFGRAHLDISRGGHPSPYVVRSNGDIELIRCSGQLLGILRNPELEDVSCELGFGDKLVFYTDGAYEVRSSERSSDLEHFEELLRGCDKRGATNSADHIMRSVLGLQAGQPRDDVALIVAGVRASIFRATTLRERLRGHPATKRIRHLARRTSRTLESEPGRADHPGVGAE